MAMKARAAGHVIEAFGGFVAGNFVIGIIVFAILVIVNFVVFAKGSADREYPPASSWTPCPASKWPLAPICPRA